MKYLLLVFICFSSLLYGCATIMHGTSQEIGVSSTPSGATVSVDNMSMGETSTFVNLSRGDNHIVKVEMPGYVPFEMTITRQTSGWVWGNIVFGGLIGLLIDAGSGGLYDLNPEQVHCELKAKNPNNLFKQVRDMSVESKSVVATIYLNNGKILSGKISDIDENEAMLENETNWYKINRKDIKMVKKNGRIISLNDIYDK